MISEEKQTKLLLVDDEEGIRRVLSVTLADMGYEVLCASDGRGALDLFTDFEPAIVLADIKMPGIDGIELLKAIKSRRSNTEVIMITGHGDMDAAILSLQLDATDFIHKPIHPGALEVALKRAGERITMRDQLARYTENLERLVEEKTHRLIEAERMAAIGQTIAGLSHTIKHIAGGLKGGAFVVEKGLELDEDRYVRQGWDTVKGNVEKIARLSMDLLNFAKTSQPHQPRWCNPNRPMEEVAAFIRPQAEAAAIGLDIDLCPAPAPVLLDLEPLYQALLNLSVNALDAFAGIDDARARVIRLKTAQPPGWAVAYHVIDNGSGMDQHTQANLCRTFFTTKGSSGTGIGLMMTRRIVEKHKGKITFRSDPGRGTEVTIKLPEGAVAGVFETDPPL